MALFISSAAIAESYISHTAVKAAFVYNFLKFTSLPSVESAGENPIRICIIEGDEMEVARSVLKNKSLEQHPIELIEIRPGDEVGSCHVLFIEEDCDCEKQVLPSTAGRRILTIGESPTFLSNGGMINFLIEDSRVRFEISTGNLDRERLQVSSKLLSLSYRRQ